MTILLLAGAALAALAAFRRAPEGAAATEGETTLGGMRREVSVLFELAKAAWMLIEALLFVTGIRQATPSSPHTPTTARPPGQRVPQPPFGTTPAADVVAGT